MSKLFKNRDEVAYTVDLEGLGYFVCSYCDASEMPDKELEKAMLKAQQAIDSFYDLLPEVKEEGIDYINKYGVKNK